MPPPQKHGPHFTEDLRRYVMKRDRMCCQWPGCGSTVNVEVLFIVEKNGKVKKGNTYYSNGVLLCAKHMDLANLHDKAFGPLIFDLIQLVEFENDLQENERTYKEILK